jgi:hypothetical protein
MKKKLTYRIFVYFLSISLLLLMGGFPQLIAEAKDLSWPIGEMVSRGDVKYETGGNSWKKVETTHFPVFQGVKIKTEKGTSIVALANNSQIEVSQNSILSLEETDRLQLSQGTIDFRIPASSETNIRVSSLSIIKSRPLQAARDSSVTPGKDEGIVGSITLHTNGSVTVKSEKGAVSILNQQRNVLATVSSKESVTIPSAIAAGKEPVMVAQAGEGKGGTGAAAAGGGTLLLGLSTWAWIGIGATAGAVAGLGVSASDYVSKKGAVCP